VATIAISLVLTVLGGVRTSVDKIVDDVDNVRTTWPLTCCMPCPASCASVDNVVDHDHRTGAELRILRGRAGSPDARYRTKRY
jgi:hypothetical protein